VNDREQEKVPEIWISKVLNELAARFQFSDFVYICFGIAINWFGLGYLLESWKGDRNWLGLLDLTTTVIVIVAIVIIRRREWKPANSPDVASEPTAESETTDPTAPEDE